MFEEKADSAVLGTPGVAPEFAGLSPVRSRDVQGRLRVHDVEGVAAMTSVPAERVKRLLFLLASSQEGATPGLQERAVLKTPDARKLSHDLLSIFVGESSSE